jgi:hypothetical protein
VACEYALVSAPSVTGTPADRAVGDEVGGVCERVRAERLEADLAHAPGLLDLGEQVLELGERGGRRLLQQQVRAGGEGEPRQVGVGVDRGGDDRDVRADGVEQLGGVRDNRDVGAAGQGVQPRE